MNFPDSDTSFARPVDVNVSRLQPNTHDNPPFVSHSPPNYGSTSWWDELLEQYSPSGPEQSFQDIITDITFLFSTSSYWLSFVCLPILIRDLGDPTQRGRLQPFIMSALAMAMLMKSSELECGPKGRDLACLFHQRAKASLLSACNSQSVDYTLAEAALMQALFESSAHPNYSSKEATSALELLDRIIHVLSLTSMDRGDSSASSFHRGSAPIVDTGHGHRRPTTCICTGHLFTPNSPSDPKYLSQSFSPPWDPQWGEEEIRKEECRRLCWCALTLVSTYTAQCAAFHTEPMEFRLADPANYVLLFPGEAFERATNHQHAFGQSPKESVWALYCRSMLLWNSSSIIQRDDTLDPDDRARFAIDVFHETRDIQDALRMHTCNMDTGLAYVCREYLYDTRMTITYELRRLQDGDAPALPPIFNRRQAEEWLFYQGQVANRAYQSVHQLGNPEGYLFARRPFQVTWFANQVAIALGLWEYDHGLMRALDLAKQFLVPLDVLNAIWPCPAQASHRDELRRRLHDACVAAGQPPPPPIQAHLPAMLQTHSAQ
ncbi:hypothetical protein VTO73DRAFT_1858 [Trametes versicolor]